MATTSCWAVRQVKATRCSPAMVSSSRSYSRLKRRKRAAQAKLRSIPQRRGRTGKPRLALQRHRDQLDSVGVGSCGHVRPIIFVIDQGHLDRLAGGGLHRCSHLSDGGPVVGRGGRDDQLQQMPQGIRREMRPAGPSRLAPSQLLRPPLSGLRWSVRLSRMAAVG